MRESNSSTLVFSIALGGYSELFASCIETHREYCERCDYDYVLVERAPRKMLAVEAAWLKVAILELALESDYKWIGFVDADCDIRAHTPPFDEALGEAASEKSVFMAQGFSGRINSGVIFVRNELGAKRFLSAVLKNADRKVPAEDRALYENGHIIAYAKGNKAVAVVDAQKWNNNRTLCEESYIQHYSGGILRNWYLTHRASGRRQTLVRKKKNVFPEGLKRFARRLLYDHLDINARRVRVSASMSELMPFYKEQYRGFLRGHNEVPE